MKTPKPKRIVVGSGSLDGPYLAGGYVVAGVGSETLESRDRKTLKLVHDFGRNPGFLSGGVPTGIVVTWDPSDPHVGVRDAKTGLLVWSRPCLDLVAHVRRGRVVIRDQASVSILRDDGLQIYPQMDAGPEPSHDALPGEAILIGTAEETIAVADNGVELWRRPLQEEILRRAGPDRQEHRTFTAAMDGDECFAFAACGTCKVSLADGAIVWTNDIGPSNRPLYCSPTLTSDLVLGADGQRLFGIERGSGRVRFNVQHAELGRAFRENTGVAFGRRFAICYQSGQLAVADIDTGSLVSFLHWKQPLSRMMELDGRLLVAAGDGELLVFDESIWGM